ncbi:hypothetical protein ACQPZA_23825 [Pseudonocardia xinjiangensis]|uniref:hypothetical protein n=1 Tax=Pseudonocardia xinjiangensis TaxID=75289 RepID=UPI003D928270
MAVVAVVEQRATAALPVEIEQERQVEGGHGFDGFVGRQAGRRLFAHGDLQRVGSQ